MLNRFRLALVFQLLTMGFLFALLAYNEHQPFREAEIRQEAVKEAVVTDIDSEDPLCRQVDFVALKEINQDIIGWIYIPQIGVDQPILQGRDNSEYLHLDFEGNYSPLGSIFTWVHTDESLQEQHICFFAHNMLSGQMFGGLKKFQDQTFAEENGTLYIYTPERTKEFQIVSTFECYKTDAVFQDDWDSGTGFQCVTLATCSGVDDTPYRLVVNCEIVREKIVL